MKKTFCRVMGLLLTLCLLVGMLAGVNELTRLKNMSNLFDNFTDTKREYDVLLFGSSHMWDGVYPMELWAETGIASYNMAYTAARLGGVYWVIRCALEHAAPKVIILDPFLIEKETPVNLAIFQDAMAALPFSLNKIRAAYDLCPPGTGTAEERAAVVWGFSKFHSRWPDLMSADFTHSENPYYGAFPLVNVAPPHEAEPTDEALALDDSYPNVPYLRRIAELCREKNIRLVLTAIPYPANREETMAVNGVAVLAQELGVEYLNALDMDLINFRTDFFDNEHLNVSGGLKYTAYLGNWLRENTELPDHRGDPAYAQWEADYLWWKQEKASWVETQRELPLTLMLLSDPDYASVIRISPGSSLFEEEKTRPLLKNLCGGAALPGFEEAAASGKSYLLLVNRSRGMALESVGTDTLNTPLGMILVEPARSQLTLGEEPCSLSAEGDQSDSDAMCFVFTSDMEPLSACSHAFALSVDGVFARCDY